MGTNYLQAIKRPEYFQGEGRSRRRYFEGWYFKHDIVREGVSYAFIPGISYAGPDSHAFIQVIRSNSADGSHFTRYIRYPADSFRASTRELRIEAGNSSFTEKGCRIDIKDQAGDYSISGDISYGDFRRIRKTAYMPGIMGPFAYIPAMECNHGIISMEHALDGKLDDNGTIRDFSGSTGYIEKDWGTSFPREYLWLQAPGFMLSIAEIPFAGLRFTGFLCVLSAGGKEYRFATYNSTRITNLSYGDKTADITLTGRGGRETLIVRAEQTSRGGSIIAPEHGKMDRPIKECLSAHIDLRLASGNDILFEKSFFQASMEHVTRKDLPTGRV